MNAHPTHTPGGTGFLARYEGLRDRLPGADMPAIAALREAAAAAFRRSGIPTRRVEAWRYTDLGALGQMEFREPLTAVTEQPSLPAARTDYRAVFVNGRFRADLSALPPFARPLADALPDVAAMLRAPNALSPMEAVNAMLFEDGLVLELAAGAEGSTVELLSVVTGSVPMAFCPRHVVRLGEGASLVLIETSIGPSHSRHLHNPVLDVDVAAGAKLAHVRVQREPAGAFHLAQVNVSVASDGVYDGFALNAGGRVARSEIRVTLSGERAEAHLNGAQLASDGQVADITTEIDHAEQNCRSRQTVKTVLAGHSRGVFQGRILVRRPAQKTDGYQMNQALLLSEAAEMDSKPQLEIYADDVKCSHGATVGALDEAQLFYMRSRGIPAAPARAMLVRAFLDEAIGDVSSEPARAALEEAVADWWVGHGDVEEVAA